jgi:hypothetical protein
MLKACVDNLIKMEGKDIYIEAMMGSGSMKASYSIGDNGISLKDVTDTESFVAVGLD